MTNSRGDIGSREQSAIEDELLNELYREMLRVARHRLHHKSDAIDVVQEAWVRILEKRDTLRESNKIIPWAKTIAANLALNANRARRVKPVSELSDSYAGESGAMRLNEPEVIAELSDILGRLEPATRTLLLYKFYYGFKDDEIAAALQVPVGTIKARIHRGKARLKAESGGTGAMDL
ncbi:RNA polymerase sigma factor [Cohnella sp. JJ-181]|uniref:RNA polymerase sigma factor n=1 Tax=Cohnella rhizoplanae TaxID=2974897 RepID=UPI0022FF574D|nr:RNA polymerase sigma factor [Cohnella sp. JJ-181]CAI6046738.1 ECF RNA polymerase sigma factor SigH [Cohnella sp. JJ-181]